MFKSVIAKRIQIDMFLTFSHKNVQKDTFLTYFLCLPNLMSLNTVHRQNGVCLFNKPVTLIEGQIVEKYHVCNTLFIFRRYFT